jgi:hypothetical protein
VHADNLLANCLRGIINSIPPLDDVRIKTGAELNELLFPGLQGIETLDVRTIKEGSYKVISDVSYTYEQRTHRMKLGPVPVMHNSIKTVMAMTTILLLRACRSPVLLAVRSFYQLPSSFARIWKVVEGPAILTLFHMVLDMKFWHSAAYLLHDRKHCGEVSGETLLEVEAI